MCAKQKLHHPQTRTVLQPDQNRLRRGDRVVFTLDFCSWRHGSASAASKEKPTLTQDLSLLSVYPYLEVVGGRTTPRHLHLDACPVAGGALFIRFGRSRSGVRCVVHDVEDHLQRELSQVIPGNAHKNGNVGTGTGHRRVREHKTANQSIGNSTSTARQNSMTRGMRSLSEGPGCHRQPRGADLVATSISTTEDLVRAKRRFLKARSVRLHFCTGTSNK